MDEATLLLMTQLFDRVNAANKGSAVEVAIRVGDIRHRIVNTVAEKEIKNDERIVRK